MHGHDTEGDEMRLAVHVRRIEDGVAKGRDAWRPPVVFLPALGFRGHSLAEVASELDGCGTRFLVDLPRLDGAAHVTSGDIVDAIADALETRCPTPPVLVGHSIGGAIAVRLIARGRVSPAALVLVDAPVAAFSLSWWERIALHPLLWIPLLWLAGPNRVVRAALPHLLREPPIADGWDVRELSRQVGDARCRHTLIAYYREFLAPAALRASEQALAFVHAPVLLLRGARDHVVPNSVMARVVEALPPQTRVEARAFAFGGHLLPLEEPQAVARAIDEFVAELPYLATRHAEPGESQHV